ncbi:hypothetical protein KC929_02870 [Patescibacteria group bacterium]|nr:hypothetical protein [Patescibacteria group bacterium]
MDWIKNNKTKSIIILILLVFITWFFTREIQTDLPYKLSGSEIITVKEYCRELGEKRIDEIKESQNKVDLISTGFSEKGGFCYVEYFEYHQDFTSKKLYNTTEGVFTFMRKWPDDENWYQIDFDWFIKGRKNFYRTTF